MLRATAVVEVQESESHMEAERAGVKGYFRVGSYRRRLHSSLSRAARIKSDCREQMRRSRVIAKGSRQDRERYAKAAGRGESDKSDNTLRQVEISADWAANVES